MRHSSKRLTYIAWNLAIDRGADLLFVFDEAGRLADLNPAAQAAMGLDRRSALGKPLPEPWASAVARSSSEGTAPLVMVHGAGGGDQYYEGQSEAVLYGRNRRGSLFILHERTELVKAERDLRESEEKFRTVAESSVVGMFIFDGKSLLFLNRAFTEITGYDEESLAAVDHFDMIHPDYRERQRQLAAAQFAGGAGVARYEFKIITRTGKERWVEASVDRIQYGGRPAMVGSYMDISERKEAEIALAKANAELSAELERSAALREQLREQAIRDVLTGLFNRRYLEETLDREVSNAERRGEGLAVLMLDIDHFKLVNDRYGHQAGDLVLGALGKTLSENVRTMDIACRYGGEEFVLILPRALASDALARAEELRCVVGALAVTWASVEIKLTISIGVATFPEGGKSGDALLQAADAALYAAKSAGRNVVRLART